jgi:hypothetical protein
LFADGSQVKATFLFYHILSDMKQKTIPATATNRQWRDIVGVAYRVARQFPPGFYLPFVAM